MSAGFYMQARGGRVPRFSYALAASAGLLCAWPCFFFFFSTDMGDGIYGSRGLLPMLFMAFVLAMSHAFAGIAFGLAWPGKGWRWGVWLCAASACIYSFYIPAGSFFPLFVATFAAGCAGSHAASKRA